MPTAVSPARSMTVLLAEDEILVRVTMADALRDAGYAVVETSNAEEALAVLNSDTPVDLVLTDMRMPREGDGAVLVRGVRNNFPVVKIVMLAGQTPDEVMLAELDAFFLKPCDPLLIVSQIQALMPAITAQPRD
jgi:CheY-like chemotaxis protein